MAKNYPAFVNATAAVTKILEKIKIAATPDRFTQDYLATELGFPGGGARAFIPLAKKLGLLGSDGTPTDLYKQFRNTNSSTSKAAMAKAIKNAYSDVYARNEYAHSLSRADFEGLIVEMTGLEKGNPTVKAIAGTFDALKAFAEFKAIETEDPLISIDKKPADISHDDGFSDVRLGLSYTINLVLPKTDDVSVFNAIFRSLRENLLRK
ncbi:hypothetical protein SAMN03159398_01760 [Pseudomonas sp. NFPP02]|uniref:DUF5343 domain-containing protein n=1 Tax=Pseudomonas sp. NFPP02 TaxID=1566216 RepID=UPI0009161AB4|nr:DUF5343 domain-containing protein [Pseudomonas sp. NFPP02]SFX46016.1 hypothetical protein SAMN03159398_01760 [Pseudomonas sp. NFPP02]